MPIEYDEMMTLSSPRKAEKEEKLDMFVPDRILVVGQDQYFGTTAPPRELRLENSVRPPDPGYIRVETPPRVISMNEHRFPTVGEDEDMFDSDSSPPSPVVNGTISMVTPKKNQVVMPVNDNEWGSISALNGSELLGRALPPGEEMNHLRRQMAKLNRRLMAMELDTIQRQQREKYLLAVGLGHEVVVVKNGQRICGSGGCLASAPLVQNKAYFEVKLQQGGVWGCGLATRSADLNVAPGGHDSESWVLCSDQCVRHGQNSLHRLTAPIQEGDVLGIWFDHEELNFSVNGKSLQVPVRGVKGTMYPALYVDEGAILDLIVDGFNHAPPAGYDKIMLEQSLL